MLTLRVTISAMHPRDTYEISKSLIDENSAVASLPAYSILITTWHNAQSTSICDNHITSAVGTSTTCQVQDTASHVLRSASPLCRNP